MARSAGNVAVASYGYGTPPGPFSMPQVPAAALSHYAPPPSLTAGLPDPVSVERQKSGYMRSLEDQEKQNAAALDGQRKQRLDYIHAQAEQTKRQLLMQIDQKVKTQEMQLTQQYNEQLLQLNQQYHTQKAALEQQALQLTMQFQQKVMQDEMMKKQMELQKEQYEVQHKFQMDMQKLQSEAHATTPPAGPLGAVVPQTNGSYVPPPCSAPSAVGSYAPPPVLQATSPYGSTASVGMATNGSFQLPVGGAAVMQPQAAPYGSSYVAANSVPARTMPAASSFASARPDPLAASGYVSAPAVIGPLHSQTSFNSARPEPMTNGGGYSTLPPATVAAYA